MEATGLAIGIIGLAGQLARVTQEWSNIFSEMKEIGYAHDCVLHDLRTEGFRLKQWEHAWGLDNTSSQQSQHLDPSDERYRYAIAGLARIVSVFTKVAELQAQYQSEPENKDGKRNSLRVRRLFSRIRSKSPHPEVSVWQTRNPSPQSSIPSPNPVDLSLLENPKVLTNEQLLPGLNEEIACLSRVAQNVQQYMPIYRKLRWASTDKMKCNELVCQLKKYVDGLFDVLPPDVTLPRMPQTRSLNLSFDIPFSLPDIRRNSDFVGREDLLEQLNREIKGAATIGLIQIVLYGMGGMGKTHLALEYVYRNSRDYSSVFWINAASEQSIKASFTHIMQRLIQHHAKFSDPYEPDYTYIGRLLGIAGKLNAAGILTVQKPSEEQQVVDAVKEWFAAKNNTKWLLVFDNLDDLESFDINKSIPSSAHGTVIITSRRRECVQGRRCLEVKQMDTSEAERLLFRSAKPDFERLTPEERVREKEAAATIVQKLECLPLAIDQAGAHIYVRQYSFSRYLTEYNTNVSYFLSKEWKVGKCDRSVFAAWDLSFNAIESQNSKAAELLLICGLLDNNDICEELLQRGMKLPVDGTSLGESIQVLFSYSMAQRKGRDDSFSIHPLVHIWAQWKLKMEPERYSKKAIEALLIVASAIHIPMSRKREVKDWVFERRTLPHIIALQRQMKTLAMEHLNTETMEALDDLRTVYMEHGYYKEAEEVCKILLLGSEKLLCADHPDTLRIVNSMAGVSYQQGQYDRALELFEQALAGREKVLGADHSDTLRTVNSIAGVLYQQGQYDKALELFERVLAGRGKTLDADHPDHLTTVNNMALIFQQQGQYNKALEFYKRALAGTEKALGADHPDTLRMVNNMAEVLYQQGQYDKALELFEQALAGREKVLSADHLDTLRTVNNMAGIFYQQGQYDRALELFERALAGREKALGTDHPGTLTTVNNIAMIFEQQGKYNKALELYERAVTGTEKVLGVDHLSTLSMVENRAQLFFLQGQYDTALELFQRASAGMEKALGADHPDTLATVNNIAKIFEQQGQYNKALEFYERAVTGIEKALGPDHPYTLTIIRNMVISFEAIGQSEKARELRERACIGSPANAGI
ncbi:hypothetical protein BDZ91DRAFT_850828 [Kalaharituber pfeilii]|nr:hypothetical protein BDZ91DRAFT_850828 [Kalaharituber pfeilii]